MKCKTCIRGPVGEAPVCINCRTANFSSYKAVSYEPNMIKPICYGRFMQGQDAAERDCDDCTLLDDCQRLAKPKAQATAPVTPDNSASGFLRRADHIMDQRASTYDAPAGERSMARTVLAFNAITGRDLTEAEGWLLMQLLKDARQWQRPDFHQDSADDCVAYAALKAEALAHA